MSKYYKASGNFSLKSFPLLLLVGLLAFPILGLIYAYAIWYIPFIYINFLIAGGFGFLIGLAVDKIVIKYGAVRNPFVGAALGFLGALIALYFHWSVWIDLVINAGEQYGNSDIGVTASNIKILQVFELALNPQLLFSLIGEVNTVGTWGIKSATVSGWPLTVIWVLEALIITVVPVFMAYTASKEPYCEVSNTWFKARELPAFNFIENAQGAIVGLENGIYEIFADLGKTENLKENHSVFTLYASGVGEYYLTIDNKTATINSKKELEIKEDTIVEYIAIDREFALVLLSKEVAPKEEK